MVWMWIYSWAIQRTWLSPWYFIKTITQLLRLQHDTGKGEIRSRFRADSQNFPVVLPYLSAGLPITFRSNKTIIQIIQQASTDLTVSFGIVISNVNQAWLYISQQIKSFRHGLKPNYILEQPITIDWYASTIQIFYLLMTILYLLIMSTFIQIPNRINQLTKKSKLEEIFVYAAIRSQIKGDDR